MTARPVDWSPLADRDPVAGDSYAVSQEAKYYSNVAQEISDQVTRLRKIAARDELVGKTAEKLRSAASDTADKIEKMHGRFAAVGSALTAWVQPLETAQKDTLDALHAAQQAVADQNANKPPDGPAPEHPTDAQKQAEHTRAQNYAAAGTALAAARTKFDDALAERDRQANKIAGKINDSLHDGLKDGFWDHIAHWVSQHVGMIKMVVEVLSWIATGLAVLSIFFPVLLPFAALFTGLTMLGHALLAATGNGSWFEVALDAFALVTMGAGSVLGGLARGARLAAVGESADLEGSMARAAVQLERTGVKAGLEDATSTLAKRFLTVKGWRAASALKGFDATTAELADAAETAARSRALARTLPEVSKLESLAAGAKDVAEPVKDLRALAAEFPDSDAIAQLARTGGSVLNANRVTVGIASATDLSNHFLSQSSLPGLDHLPHSAGWEHFKEDAGQSIAHALHLPGAEPAGSEP
ncbi:MAG TPA: hypothetical protein VFT67_10020 [Jatrophihabitantaceae bacterium]|jgi:hypothetical protein|nr:hypothetical protein [Jatrophihabitantaceae bacterium]